MSKKKKKVFPKSKILELFKNQNYQKVVSKIKQFRIEDMDDLEVDKIHIDSLKMLSSERFKAGDTQRAIRDIEFALNIKLDNDLEFLRLKYLCYLDNFSDAKIYVDELLEKYKTDKKIIFYSLLIDLHLNNKIDKTKLKKVTKAKQEYLLAIFALFNNDTSLALKHLNNSKPRAKAEKNNIEAIKAIVLQKTDIQIKDIKPLYKFLLSGDDTNLQNSKNSRESKDEIVASFKLSNNTKSLKKLIELDSYIDNAIVKKESNPKLALNNITMMLEKNKEPDYEEIYKIFISYEKEFVNLIESIYTLIKIFKNFDSSSVAVKITSFVEKYLEIHSKKLAPFTLIYILYQLLYHNFTNTKAVKMIELLFDKYGNKDIFYTTLTFAVNYDAVKMYDNHKANIEIFFKKYSHVNSIVVRNIIEFIDSFEYAVIYLDSRNLKNAANKLESSLYVIKNLSDVDEKYKSLFLELLNSFSKAIFLFEEDELERGYDDIKIVLKKYIDLFNYEESQFCEEADEFLDSSVCIENSYTPNIVQEKYIKFKLALKTGFDPFVELENYPLFYEYFYAKEDKTAVFDLIMEYARFEDLNDEVIAKIFKLTNFNLKKEFLRTTIQTVITKYAKVHLDISQKIFQYILKTTDAQSVWYLNWLYSYIDMVDVHNLDKDAFFVKCLNKFLDIQNRKKFKSIQKRYDLVLSRFDVGDAKNKTSNNQQQTFKF
ncbi:MAG: hypothetical protein U9N02_02195 [Campylobacterota bacterium]|nr:hypothetical protein [Campylobacterota bacterium]